MHIEDEDRGSRNNRQHPQLQLVGPVGGHDRAVAHGRDTVLGVRLGGRAAHRRLSDLGELGGNQEGHLALHVDALGRHLHVHRLRKFLDWKSRERRGGREKGEGTEEAGGHDELNCLECTYRGVRIL